MFSLGCRCWTLSSHMSLCVFLYLCPTSSTLLWPSGDGSTLTCSRSWNSPLFMTQQFCGRMASVARLKLNYKVQTVLLFSSCFSKSNHGWKKCFVFCFRSHVPHQHAHKWGGSSCSLLQDRSSLQGTVCYVSSRYEGGAHMHSIQTPNPSCRVKFTQAAAYWVTLWTAYPIFIYFWSSASGVFLCERAKGNLSKC